MARVRVKICGITNPDDALAAVEAGADAIGVVFAESPRQIDAARAAEIVKVLPPWVSMVGVFVDETPEQIAAIARRVGLHVVQFHGDVLPCVLEQFAAEFKIVKAFRVGSATDLGDARDYLEQCRPTACLVDARVSGQAGGTGRTAPWELVAGFRREFWPLVLSGGLRPGNVAEAIRIVQPFGVEASSGVEKSPGRKDAGLIKEFVSAAGSVSVTYPQIGENE